ncbi:UvrD-helicase domain-containing protein [Halorussus pelagicus]|uniref:UvrD-helicase domain-containing protein n=1 Tax=Halorussus pelagicus TaxID=2505977 RepID=UPI000FFBE7AD|nr:UvrD-helicase domain-containing protein [Halorussus pelagicus]
MTWEEIQQDLDDDGQGVLARLLPNVFAHRIFGDPEERRRRHERRREEAREAYENEVEPALDRCDDLEDALSPAVADGESLPADVPAKGKQIGSARERLANFRSAVDKEYLTESELTAVSRAEESLSEYEVFIPAKRRYDERIALVTRTVETLETALEPFVNYDRYMTTTVEETLRAQRNELREDLRSLRSDVNLSVLSDADTDQLERVEAFSGSVSSLLDGYNDEFVNRRIDDCEDLFTDIDDAGHDLNRDQCEAVVRNDTYNQVVAAAGTGKTFALTYRIAYLVTECGVAPDRIAALTYTTEAAKEMEDRLEAQFGIADVTVRTIHSFAYRIAREAADGDPRPPQSGDVYNLIDDVIRKETSSGETKFAHHYVQFLYHYKDEYLDRTDFESKADYVAERAEQTYETLAGETVASRAEKVVADFLFAHGVAYQYESIAEWADTAEDKGAYRPDFYLPEYDLYIEHWGIDEDGEVAPWFSWTTEEYLGKLRWARGEFDKNDEYELIDTYDFEHQRDPDHLRAVLKHRLARRGVELDRMAFEDLVDSTFEYHEKERDIKESFKEFVENAKTFDVGPDEIADRLNPERPRQYHFGRCAAIVLRRYDDYLARNDLVDFNDMIYDAIAAIEDAPDEYRGRYDHVLVDEFQDVAMSQIRLVNRLTGPDAAKLFCVGDDWQSIYSFQGSEVEYFIDFEEHFGPAAETYLTENYRCPATVLEAGNDLIRNNDDQIEKTVSAESGRDTTPKLHTLEGFTDGAYARRVGEYAADLVEQCVESGSDPGDVMVLCRYDGGAPYLDELKKELETREIPYDGKEDHYRPRGFAGEHSDDFDPEVGVSAFSVHQSKGREAEHVILLHAAEGVFGFPAEDRDDELVAPVREVATNTLAEERRLFYVAITRTEGNLHVLTKQNAVSPFAEEIRDYVDEVRSVAAPGEVGGRTTLTAAVNTLFEDTHSTQRQAGVLRDETGTVRFVSWESDDPPEVEEGVWYRFEDVTVNEYNDDTQIVVSGDATTVELYREETDAATR